MAGWRKQALFYKGTDPIMKALPSWSHYLPKVSSPIPSHPGVKFYHMNLGLHKHLVHSGEKKTGRGQVGWVRLLGILSILGEECCLRIGGFLERGGRIQDKFPTLWGSVYGRLRLGASQSSPHLLLTYFPAHFHVGHTSPHYSLGETADRPVWLGLCYGQNVCVP